MSSEGTDLHIWRYTHKQEDHVAESTHPLLSKQEQERCAAYLNDAEKIRYTCNHRFVRQVLSRYTGLSPREIVFSHAQHGKPFIKGSDIFFSYSYRADQCLLAVSRQEKVGVDIEKMKTLQDLHTFADFCFSEQEKQIIFGSGEALLQDTLFTFWTFKEAIIKALGVGLNTDLTHIELSGFLHQEANALSADGNNLYTMRRISSPSGYRAAFAVEGKVLNYHEFDFDQRLFS